MQIPKNVVQAGDVDSCHKIYIEDYVHTYLSQCRETDSSADFCLYGTTEKEGDVRYYFIYGAAKEGPGWEITARRYFAKQSRIGEATYDDKEAWLFFEDGYATPLEGYFIFYEQNEDMQSYLIAVHQNQPGETVQEVVPRAASRSFERKARDGQAGYNTLTNRTGARQEERIGDRHGEGTGDRPESEVSAKEPRRILRMPRSYDIDPAGKQEDSDEKIMQAAEASDPGRPDSRAYERKPSSARRSLFGDTDSRYPNGRTDSAQSTADRTPGSTAPDSRRTDTRMRGSSVPRKPAGSGSSFVSRAAGLIILLVLCGIGVTSINRYNDMKEAGNLFADAAHQPETENVENALDDSALQIEEKQASLPDSDNPAQASNTDTSSRISAGTSEAADANSSAAAASVTDPSSIDPAAISQAELPQTDITPSGSSQSGSSQTGSSQPAPSQTSPGQSDGGQTGDARQTDSLPVMSSSVNSTGQDGQAAADTSPTDKASSAGSASGQNDQAGQQARAEQTPPTDKGQNPDENKDVAQPASDITSEAVAASASVPSSYIVKSGDNLANICRHFYGNLEKMDEICELNSISDPNRLAAGQKIILPK